MAVSFALNGAGCAGSVAMLHHLVPERIPLQKPSKTCLSVGERVCCAVCCVSHNFTQQVDAPFNATPGI